MAITLKDHPFAVETYFKTSLVLTYAIPKNELIHLLPPCLTLDTWKDEWAFVAVALVDTKKLRPKGFPAFLGNDFILAGYRIFVRYINEEGKRLRGLYILKSETNKHKMSILGNLFTHYNYTTTDIVMTKTTERMVVNSNQSDLDIEVCWDGESIRLPKGSPFADWKEARRFAGPLPFTFTFNPEFKRVLIIEGVRSQWNPKPVEVIKHEVGFLKQLGFKDILLANAFVVENVPYYWKKGKIEQWEG